MDSSFEGFVLDPSKCSELTMEEKRELVYEISKWSHGAPEMLQSWSRRELLQILCAEMGKERKYTGLTKFKIIEHLLKIISEKKCVKQMDGADLESQPSPANNQNTSKRQRKTDKPSRLPISTNHCINNSNGDVVNAKYCQNSACRATLRQEDTFCKRCSCCICYQYDDNKDPSLWLVCSSEPPYESDSCGMSCHLECALKHERAGIAKEGIQERLDGSYYCASCGKVNDLLGCWRKQLMTAKDTRRVDVLCYRVSLSQKLLRGTKKYQKLNEIVETALKKLEAEVGPLAGLPIKMARGIVNRLPSGPDIQRLCASAVESLDSLLSCSVLHPLPNPKIPTFANSSLISPSLLRFENVSPTSVTVVLGSEDESAEVPVQYSMWHHKADVIGYPAEPTCTVYTPNTRFLVSDLVPATEYVFKVVSFHDKRELGVCEVKLTTDSDGDNAAKNLVVERGQSPTTNSSILSNPSSEGDESNNITAYGDQIDNPLGTGQEATPGDSLSVLDEERILGEVGSMPNSTIQTDSQRDTSKSTISNHGCDILKPENHSPEGQLVEEMSTDNGSNSPERKDMEIVPFKLGSDAVLPITPCKLETVKDGSGRSERPNPGDEEPGNVSGKHEKETQAGSSSKKRSGAWWDEECVRDGSFDREYEYCVKMVRQLECEGHIEKNFRVKFLTWYSLRATPQERRVVKVFVDTFMDDPVSLAGQLVDTFWESISSKRPPGLPTGFCMKLWH